MTGMSLGTWSGTTYSALVYHAQQIFLFSVLLTRSNSFTFSSLAPDILRLTQQIFNYQPTTILETAKTLVF